MAFKSDVLAKEAFVNKLLSEGFDSAEIKAQPADIIAQKDGVTWYFEIKLTDHADKCFGAATLTEWAQAFKKPDYYRFVVAIRNSEGKFTFRSYTPAEFMEFSTIPPFKVYFNIDFSGAKRSRNSKKSAVALNEENFRMMNELFNKMRSENQ